MGIGRKLADEIQALLPSRALREEIAGQNWSFSDEELLLIAMQYCSLFSRRKRLLAQIAREADENTSVWAKTCLAWENRKMKAFSALGEEEVYLLRIAERGIPAEDHYVFRDFRKIPDFLRGYAADGADISVAEADKVRFGDFVDPRQDIPFSGSCEFDKRGRVLFVHDDGCEWGRCGGEICSDCRNLPAGRSPSRSSEIRFPKFLEKYDAVRFRDPYRGEILFGLIPDPPDAFAGEGCVICLDESAERYACVLPPKGGRDRKLFSDDLTQMMFHSHEHVPFPLLERVSREKLPARFRRIYDKIVADLRRSDERRAEADE